MHQQDKQAAIQPQQLEHKPSDEISLQDILREFRLWKQIILTKIIKLLIIGLVGGAIGFAYAYRDKPVYTANTRFMLKNEGVGSLFGGQMTGLTSLLGGGQMGTPLERTAEVIGSDRIVGRALLRVGKVADSLDMMINHFIRLSGIKEEWENDSLLNGIKFGLNDSNIENMTLSHRRAYKIIKLKISNDDGNSVLRKSFDKKSGVLTLTCIHENSDFAIELSKIVYDELNNFFIEQMTYTSANNAEVVRLKLDSISTRLNEVRNNYARLYDQSQGLLLQQDKVELKRNAGEEQLLNVMYSEALKNFESFDFINKAAKPSLTLIEYPFSPLTINKKSKIKYFFVSCLVAIFIAVVLYRIYLLSISSIK